MRDIFDNRQLSRTQAIKIAESQFDLGKTSKSDMVIALGGLKAKTYEGLMESRMEAYDRLDSLSQYIVDAFLTNDSIDDAQGKLGYAIMCLTKAKDSIK